MRGLREIGEAIGFLLGYGVGLGVFLGSVALAALAVIRAGRWLCRL